MNPCTAKGYFLGMNIFIHMYIYIIERESCSRFMQNHPCQLPDGALSTVGMYSSGSLNSD